MLFKFMKNIKLKHLKYIFNPILLAKKNKNDILK